jgi:hypothetical protein
LTANDPDRLYLLGAKLMVFKKLDQGSPFASPDHNPKGFVGVFFCDPNENFSDGISFGLIDNPILQRG